MADFASFLKFLCTNADFCDIMYLIIHTSEVLDMKIKKSLMLIAVICLSLILVFPLDMGNSQFVHADDTVTIYSPNGDSAVIYKSELDTYLKLGWYSTIEDATRIIYSADGRSARVFLDEVDTYLGIGWYLNWEDTVTTIYAPDGRTAAINISELETYLNLGWFQNYEDVTRTITAPDGRTAVVYASELETYLNWGWRLFIPVDPTKPMVALTFDDGPSAYYTRRIVDTLAKYNSTATFFTVGQYVDRYPEIVKYALRHGMEIGNHSYTHSDLGKSDANKIRSEISRTNAAILAKTGVSASLFRPPYGSMNVPLRKNADMPLILWSIDTLDWKSRNANSVYNTVAGKVRDGDIILMHDLYKSTADAVDMIVPYLINSGFQIVSVSTLAQSKGYNMYAGQAYSSFR